MIMVRHDRFGCVDQKHAGDNTGDFSNQLGQQIKTWFGHNDRMLVQEVNQALRPCARIVTSLPNLEQETVAKLRGWIRHWRLDKRVGEVNGDAIDFEVAKDGVAMNAHWECVRWLCGGAKPDAAFEGLGLSYRVAGDIGNGTRCASSYSCGKDLVAAGAELPFLSAFDAKNWSELYSGRELLAYQIRSEMNKSPSQNDAATIASFRARIAELGKSRGLVGGV